MPNREYSYRVGNPIADGPTLPNMFSRAIHQSKPLTARQRQVLDLLAAGKTNPQIAEELGISLDGAKWHVSEVLFRLGVTTREEAAAAWGESRSAERKRRFAIAGVYGLSLAGAASGLAVTFVVVGGMFGFNSSLKEDASGAVVVPFVCPLTVPSEPYRPTAPFLEVPPVAYGKVWYGGPDLWTMLDPAGEVWVGLPNGAGGSTQKTFWWSRAFSGADGLAPAISVSGKRLDAPGAFVAAGSATSAAADFGEAMLVGVEIPSAGCWEVTATYHGASLGYVVKVSE